jgi:hypothetical protein
VTCGGKVVESQGLRLGTEPLGRLGLSPSGDSALVGTEDSGLTGLAAGASLYNLGQVSV